MSEQRQRFLEDYQLNYYSITELAEHFSISRKTAHKWINRYKQYGQEGYQELSRRPHTCPWRTDQAIMAELVALRKKHPKKETARPGSVEIRSGVFHRYQLLHGSWQGKGW